MACAVTAGLLSSPASAQDRDNEIAALRSQLAAARSNMDALESRLARLEAPSAAPAAAPVSIAAAGNVEGASSEQDNPPPISSWGVSWIVADDEEQTPAARHEARNTEFGLIAGPDGGRASFALSRTLDYDGRASEGAVDIIREVTSLTLSAPLAKDGDTPFATLDGLASGAKFEVEFTRGHARTLTAAAARLSAIAQAARQRCRAATPAYARGCVQLDDAFKEKFFEEGEEETYELEYARAALQRSYDWSLRGALGYDEFTYYASPSLDKTKTERVSWSVGAGLTFFPFDRSSASIDLDYQRGYEAAKAATACPIPVAGATFVTCVPGPLAGPEFGEKLIMASELKYIQNLKGIPLIPAVGIAPRIEFDVLSGEVAVDFPIYLAPNGDGNLTGGVRFGYVNTDDEFKFGVFVGKAFSLF